MNVLTSIISILNLLGLGGIGIFIYYTIKGLRERINSLNKLVEEQQKTLDTVRERAEEISELSKYYKQVTEDSKKFMKDFQEMGEKLEKRRNELVKELEEANERKDTELAEFKEVELEKVKLRKQSWERIPELEKELKTVVSKLKSQLEILSPSMGSAYGGMGGFWIDESMGSSFTVDAVLVKEQEENE